MNDKLNLPTEKMKHYRISVVSDLNLLQEWLEAEFIVSVLNTFKNVKACHNISNTDDCGSHAHDMRILLNTSSNMVQTEDGLLGGAIAWDVDGTLRCNCTNTCQDQNGRIVWLYRILHKNLLHEMQFIIWSGGGKAYAERFARLYNLPYDQCMSKLDRGDFVPDIAIDDIQDTALGKYNLIVKEK